MHYLDLYFAWMLSNGFWCFVFAMIFATTIAYNVLHYSSNLTLRLFKMLFRSMTVTFRGWPPPHLDADGEWKPRRKIDELPEETQSFPSK